MSREVKDGDKIMVTKFSGRELDVPHLATVADALRIPSVFILENEINGSDVIFKDVPDCDVWFPMSEYVRESFGSSNWIAGSREVEVGDKIIVTKFEGEEIDPVEVEVTSVHSELHNGKESGNLFTTGDLDKGGSGVGNQIKLDPSYADKDGETVDEWHFADADISLDASSYEDDAITPSYSEFINSGRGRTLADYTGVEITEDSLGFVSSVDEAISSITPESLNFSEETEDVVNHPSHYGNGRFETIEMIEEITKGYDDGFVAHCVGTAVKYESRAPFKHDNPLEDLRKARKYLEFAIDHLERLEDK